jgi:ribosome modulation factor
MSHTSPSTSGEPTRRERLEARMAGYRAYLGGVSRSQNPYPLEGQALRREWQRGYSQSRTDRVIANREAGGQDMPQQ